MRQGTLKKKKKGHKKPHEGLNSCQEFASIQPHGCGSSWKEGPGFILLPHLQICMAMEEGSKQLAVNFKLYNKCDMHPMHLSKSPRNSFFSMTHQQWGKETLVNIIKQSFIHSKLHTGELSGRLLKFFKQWSGKSC